jgi:hypothetical protein
MTYLSKDRFISVNKGLTDNIEVLEKLHANKRIFQQFQVTDENREMYNSKYAIYEKAVSMTVDKRQKNKEDVERIKSMNVSEAMTQVMTNLTTIETKWFEIFSTDDSVKKDVLFAEIKEIYCNFT